MVYEVRMVLSSAIKKHLKNKSPKDEKINLIKSIQAQSNQLKALISALGNINDAI